MQYIVVFVHRSGDSSSLDVDNNLTLEYTKARVFDSVHTAIHYASLYYPFDCMYANIEDISCFI